MTQPKFKIHQKVRATDGRVFVIDMIGYNRSVETYVYGGATTGFSVNEDEITEWREPMRASFECSWWISNGVRYPDASVNILEPFIGKRTRVTLEEVLQ